MEHHWKNPSGHVGTRTCVAGLSHLTKLLISMYPKKGFTKARFKQYCLFPIRPMLILTSWLTIFLLCNQYHCTVVYILITYIYIHTFCHGTSLKKKHLATCWLEPASPVSVNRLKSQSYNKVVWSALIQLGQYDKLKIPITK